MDIVFCTDNNFAMPCGVACTSLLENNTSKDITIHILGLHLSENNKTRLLSLASIYKVNILLYEISNDLMDKYNFPVEEIGLDRITIATYIRLLITDILPKNIKKILYLDSDIMVVGSLTNLWNIDLTEYSVAGVAEDLSFDKKTFIRLQYPPTYSYINAGVLLINLDYWRNHDIITEFISYLKCNRTNILFHDQDIINGTLYNTIKLCEYRYNMHFSFYQQDSPFNIDKEKVLKEKENAIIVHYTRGRKPWYKDSSNVRVKEYQEYIKKSPWQNEPLKWMNNSFKHKIKFNLKQILILSGLKKQKI